MKNLLRLRDDFSKNIGDEFALRDLTLTISMDEGDFELI